MSQEFVIVNQARALAYLAWLMAQTLLKNQPWKSAAAEITGLPDDRYCQSFLHDHNAGSRAWTSNQPGLSGRQPGRTRFSVRRFVLRPRIRAPNWIEAEAQWPDGRRVFASDKSQRQVVLALGGCPVGTRPRGIVLGLSFSFFSSSPTFRFEPPELRFVTNLRTTKHK